MSTTASIFYSTDDEMFAALTSCYDVLQWSSGITISDLMPYGEWQSDNASVGGGGESDSIFAQALEEFRYDDSSDDSSTSYWAKIYTGIYRCNIVINAEYTSTAAEVYKAEARVLRAFWHFECMRRFGPCVVSTESDYPNDYPFTRNTRDEVNDQIESDLLAAMDELQTSFGSDMTGRINKSVAQALLAKHYIYVADWDNDNAATFSKAIPYLEAIVSSGLYQLDDYDNLFGYDNDNSSESIFEIQRSTVYGQTSWSTINTSEGNYVVAYTGPRGLSNHPDNTGGWGFVMPTDDLWNYYKEDDTVRRAWSALTPDDLVGYEYNGATSVWDYDSNNEIDFEEKALKKYTSERVTYTGSVYLNEPGNERLIRYGEVYLWLAEAYLRGNGNEAKAKEYLNALRDVHVPGGLTVDVMISTYSDLNSVLDVLWYERRCELAGEGDRWYDLVRSGRAQEVMTTFHASGRRNTSTSVSWSAWNLYYPLGTSEVSACPTLTIFPDEAY